MATHSSDYPTRTEKEEDKILWKENHNNKRGGRCRLGSTFLHAMAPFPLSLFLCDDVITQRGFKRSWLERWKRFLAFLHLTMAPGLSAINICFPLMADLGNRRWASASNCAVQPEGKAIRMKRMMREKRPSGRSGSPSWYIFIFFFLSFLVSWCGVVH